MNTIKLIKKENNKFEFVGDVDIWVDTSDNIIQNGKTYIHNSGEVKTLSVAEYKKTRYSDDYEYDFKELDYKAYVNDRTCQGQSVNGLYCVKYSENDYANCILIAFESELLDSRIVNMYTQKGYSIYYPRDYKYQWNHILKSLTIDFIMYGYGYNNFLCYSLNVRDVFLLDYKLISDEVIDIFNFHGINLKNKNKQNELIKLFNKQILKLKQDETSKQ